MVQLFINLCRDEDDDSGKPSDIFHRKPFPILHCEIAIRFPNCPMGLVGTPSDALIEIDGSRKSAFIISSTGCDTRGATNRIRLIMPGLDLLRNGTFSMEIAD